MTLKNFVPQLPVAFLGLFVSLSSLSFAADDWRAPHIVTANCSGCHAVDGNAALPYVPRLAGLNVGYLTKKMAEFHSASEPHSDELFSRLVSRWSTKQALPIAGSSSNEARINMIGIARDLTDAETKKSTTWYANQKGKPGRPGNAAVIQAGKKLFLDGSAAEGLLACQSCHGVQAEGTAAAPRIAGQNAEYLMSELQKFKTGDRKHAPEMTTVAQKADEDQFRALAAFLQSL